MERKIVRKEPANCCYFVGLEGAVIPPDKKDVPDTTYLAFSRISFIPQRWTWTFPC